MTETLVRQVSLVGQVIEDLSYAPLSPGRFTAVLSNVRQAALMKDGGFFVFTNLKSGNYVLEISAEEFQTQELPVTIPVLPQFLVSPAAFDNIPMLDVPGNNELVVVIRAVNSASRRITFDPEILTKEIRAGALVPTSAGLRQLTETLEPGLVSSARLDSIDSLTPGSVVRIVRARSIRLKFDPYRLFPEEITRLTGRVTSAGTTQEPIAGVRVRLTEVNGLPVTLNNVSGAQIATTTNAGQSVVLGSEQDVSTLTNANGDYNLYFSKGTFFNSVTMEATANGFLTLVDTRAVLPGKRSRVDFQLSRI